MNSYTHVQIAVPVPLRQLFTYSIPAELQNVALSSGQLVEVPFGHRQLVAMVIETHISAPLDVDASKIKPITRIFTHQHQLPQSIIKLLHTAANYYSHPIGEVIQHALPVLMRQEEPEPLEKLIFWRATTSTLAAGLSQLNVKRSPKQGELFTLIFNHAQLTWQEIRTLGYSKTQLDALANKALIAPYQKQSAAYDWSKDNINSEDKLHLTAEQAIAVSAIGLTIGQYACHLVHGITGSGKTEVYLQVMEKVLAKSQQVLVLVPEIGLTPQMLARFEQRFNVPIFLHHSGLNDRERFSTWCHAQQGEAAIIIGTRSALFTPLEHLALIIVDEEHDTSFKQQDSFRYNGRDLAIIRANQLGIPIVLGSATPSFESLANANSGKFHYHQLTQRPGNSIKATLSLVDINNQPLTSGLAASTIRDIEQVLTRNEQVLVFLNRRGFAPAINCKECHWVADCTRCNRPYTLHKNQGLLICHHCNSQKRIPHQCPSCGSIRLTPVGQGTEQVEQWLEQHFADKSIVRIDRDSTRRKGELAKRLEQIKKGEHHILIGTQMLAKGHHFPNVTLVVMLDIDGALFSFDYRAAEHMAQQLEQVAGRAGRASKPGKVLIQTQYPQHPLLVQLVTEGYSEFAKQGLEERRWAKLPPFGHQVLIRAEANQAHLPEQFLRDMSQLSFGSDIAGPMPAAMEKKAGKFRFHLLFQAAHRKTVHQDLQMLITSATLHRLSTKVRWSIDVDPIDLSW